VLCLGYCSDPNPHFDSQRAAETIQINLEESNDDLDRPISDGATQAGSKCKRVARDHSEFVVTSKVDEADDETSDVGRNDRNARTQPAKKPCSTALVCPFT